ncbi:MAG: type I polyketide synthase, partial [Anaerolineae bacterium]|nr:type I polyketide synthase [Anaerolineae bacterium]
VLKRLSDAQANGDRILAVIRGSAVNQDGRSSGLTVPNGPAQEAVIRKALASAGVQPSQVSYVETHGTGTAIGDPIEVEAIGAALGAGRPKDLPLVIGAVKSNIGHAESASGIAGVIKTVLMLQQGEIPRNLHFHEPSPRIPWPDFPVVVPTEHMPWTPIDGKRIAGISGFGFSGTNAHVILEEASLADFQPTESDRPAHILALSGRDTNALRDLAGRYADFFAARPDVDPGDVGYTANRGRAQFTQRLAVVGATADELRERLAAYAAGEEAVGLVSGAHNPKARARVAFLFTGQGAQYAGMGRQLYETQPVFRAALDQCAALLAPHLDQPLLSVLFPAEGAPNLIDQTTYTQPALFALEYALAQMWRAWGIEPSMVMGHSVGEYVAACIAGVFSLEDGLKLIAARGRLMGALPAGGAMAAVFADAERVRTAVEPYAREVSVAAYNGPENIVISGAATVIDTLLEQFKAEGIKSRRLVVSHAFHSPLMDPILAEFERVAAQVQFSQPRLKLISNRSGATAGAEIASARYWRDHIREAVQFSASIQAAQGQGATVYLEIGPGTTLLGMGQRIIQGNAAWLPSLRPGKDDWSQTLESLGRLYIEGLPVNWDAFDQPYARRKIALPTYPFQRERYWTNASAAPSAVQSTRSRGGHPLLGERIPLAGNAELLIWENEISLRRLPYLDDHRVQGAVIVPATAYMEMGLAAVVEAVGPLPLVVRAVQNRKPLFLRDGDTYTSQLTLTRGAGDEWHFDVYSRAAGQNWTHHVSGTIAQADAAPSLLDGFDAQAIMARCTEEIRGEAFYAQLAEKGNQWGPTFQGIENLWRGAGEALSFVRVPDAIAGQLNAYQIHPAVADSCGHVLTATISMQRSDDSRGGAFVGGGVDETRVYARPSGTGLW